MKNITEFIKEHFDNNATVIENNTENVLESKIESEKDFRAAAKAKFEEVFGDDLDEDKMNDTIDGILNDNKELVDDSRWEELIGILNKSFTK